MQKMTTCWIWHTQLLSIATWMHSTVYTLKLLRFKIVHNEVISTEGTGSIQRLIPEDPQRHNSYTYIYQCFVQTNWYLVGGSLAVVCSYAPGCEPLVTGDLAMGLTIRSSHKQELSSVYQFIDVLYSLCIYEALRHWSLSCSLLRVFSVLSSCSLWRSLRVSVSVCLSRTVLCKGIYTKLAVIRLATIGRRYYWSHTSGRSVRLYTGECVVDSSTGLWDRAVLLYPV